MIVSPEEFDSLDTRRRLPDCRPVLPRSPMRSPSWSKKSLRPISCEDLELESEDDLLGLYQGVPIDQTSFFQPAGELPARISIYRGPILRLCRTKAEVIHEVRDTVVHELGHHVGLDDDEMPY